MIYQQEVVGSMPCDCHTATCLECHDVVDAECQSDINKHHCMLCIDRMFKGKYPKATPTITVSLNSSSLEGVCQGH